MNKILKYGLIGLISGLSFINSGCKKAPEYNIDEKIIIDNRNTCFLNRSSNENNYDLYICNSKWYIKQPTIKKMKVVNPLADDNYKLSNRTHEDSVVINEAQKKVDYLLHKIDSTNKANRINRGLEALE